MALSKGTKIPYGAIWGSLSPVGKRDLRANEMLTICRFIDKSPMDFYKDESA